MLTRIRKALTRIRKALVAGSVAGIGPAAAIVAKAGHLDRQTASQALGAFVAAAAAVGWATWRTRNAGSDIGPTGSVVLAKPSVE